RPRAADHVAEWAAVETQLEDHFEVMALRGVEDELVMLGRRVGDHDDVDPVLRDVGEVAVVDWRRFLRFNRKDVVARVADASLVPETQGEEVGADERCIREDASDGERDDANHHLALTSRESMTSQTPLISCMK